MCCLTALFPLWSIPLLSSSTTLFFFLPYILNIRSFFFLVLTPFLQLHPSFHTLHTSLLSSLFSLLLLLSSSMLLSIGHITCFLLVSQEGILVLDFCRSIPSCLHIFHSLHMLLPFLLLSILSLAEVYFWGAYSSLYNIPTPFPIQDMPAFFLAVPFVVWSHVLPLPFFFSSLLLFNLNIWAFPFKMADPPISKTFHFLHHLLPLHFYLFPYSTLHHSTCYYFKFILGN